MNATHLAFREFIDSATRFLFFTGKGGVGKTSLACATAVALADAGRRVLLVSTDPASNLDEVLSTALGSEATAIGSVQNLFALNINPQGAAREYRERLVAPYRGVLPEASLRSMEEQLSGACTLEIAAFDEFTRLLGEASATAPYDQVIFDTAPTGHTLRLLSLPSAWTGFFDENTSGNSCLGPLAGLQKQRGMYRRAVDTLADASRTTLVLVSRAQRSSLGEARRTSHELAALGVRNQRLILNGLFRSSSGDATARALQARQERALDEQDSFLTSLPAVEVPLRSQNLVGLAALRGLVAEEDSQLSLPSREAAPTQGGESLSTLIDQIASAGRGVVMTMGKGGVGKTTLAAAIATNLAQRGFPVHLSTTDPAAHIAATAGAMNHLRISRIDPAAETAAYVAHVMETAGHALDANGRALLEEDLRSPCTEEIAVFHAFAQTVADGADGFVVLDTAPTGHTLLLLDATEAYHREVARRASDMPDAVRSLLPRLRDPKFTRVVIVTLPEPTPVHEAAALQEDLRRAAIEPFAWVINQSFAESATTDPVLRQRGQNETLFISEVINQHAKRVAIVPWQREEPVGAAQLAKLCGHGSLP